MKRLMIYFLALTFFNHSYANADLKFDLDVEAPLKKQMMDDIAFVQGIRGHKASPLHEMIFGAVDGPNYFAWLNKRVFSVGMDDCGNPNAVACVNPEVANKIWITQNYVKFDHPQIARLSVVYHEARHTESAHDNWSHAKCPTPFKDSKGVDMRSIWTGALLQGEPACDITAFGSYGSATIFLKNISLNCDNCSEKVKADADLFGTDQLGRIIDSPAKQQMVSDFRSSERNIQ